MAEDPKEETHLAERLAMLPTAELEVADLGLSLAQNVIRSTSHEEAVSFLYGVRRLLDLERCRRRLNQEAEVAELGRMAELP
jgi:hypothetical protein